MRLRSLTWVVSVWLLAIGVEADTVPFASGESGRLFSLHGSNTIGASLAPELVEDYLIAKGAQDVSIRARAEANEYRVEGRVANNPVYVDVAAHGSGTGMRGLASGEAQIAMASRPIKPSEQELLADFGPMRHFDAEHVVAIDGLAVIVHPSNPLNALTVNDIARLFSGEIRNWSELGGPNRPISLYARDNKSGTWDSFKSMVLQGDYSLDAHARRFESNDRLSDSVSADPDAIGFVGLASVRRAKAVDVSQDGISPLGPEPLYVATEDYALSRRLFLYTLPGQTPPLVREFIEFAQSATGQRRVAEVGFVSQNPVSLKPAIHPDAPPAYSDLVRHGERLSINFRFDSGSSRLDNKALWDIERLQQFMSQPANRDRQLQLIGFGDAQQSEQRALVLSQMRALRVKSALREHEIHAASIVGFGDGLPVADDREAGRIKNQRVEVWLFDPAASTAVNGAKAELMKARELINPGAVSGVWPQHKK
ncbi:phosphate ABC transporter substrate-binding/OmpA family protein [Marinimicrobium sp. C2-29]|uniref:phosphate ABC transporter substrate-binding/OmpA family protein n=1 Tax=Marinimicrobium sp. C2-29 TaxID=3139825 RepID=UPI0031392DF2